MAEIKLSVLLCQCLNRRIPDLAALTSEVDAWGKLGGTRGLPLLYARINIIMSNSLAPWRIPLSRALHLNRSQPYSRYFQLATVTPEGFPKNRTVVFRGYLDNTNQIKIITDLRSEKIPQINNTPWGEICWYFTKTREQFRLTGIITLVTANYPDSNLEKERRLTWQQLSDAARLQFAWPDPAQPRSKDDSAFSCPSPSSDEPLKNFCLLLLAPQKVDYLQLRGNPQNRCQYFLNESQTWSAQEVNP